MTEFLIYFLNIIHKNIKHVIKLLSYTRNYLSKELLYKFKSILSIFQNKV